MGLTSASVSVGAVAPDALVVPHVHLAALAQRSGVHRSVVQVTDVAVGDGEQLVVQSQVVGADGFLAHRLLDDHLLAA